MKMSFVVIAVLALLAMLAAGCAPQGIPPPAPTPTPEEITPIPTPEPTPTAEWGIIEIRVTDPPPADVTSVVVTLTNIEVHRQGGGWETITIGEETFDLMDVIGVTKVLGDASVIAGSFTQIRLDVEQVYVEFVRDGITDNVIARVPSKKLRIVKAFEVVGGVKTVLTLDFDGKKSLVLPGKDIVIGKERAIFKPVIKLLVSEASVALEITTTHLPDGVVGEEYEAEVEATGGTGSYTWSIIPDGDLPDGLELDPDDGKISGTPEAGSEGDYTFTVQVEDDSDPAPTDTQEFTISIHIGT